MRLSKDRPILNWGLFSRLVNERFGPPTRANPLGELATLRRTSTVDAYTESFLALVARVGDLQELQQVNIYTAGLLEPLKTEVELARPKDMEEAMSLARAYERCNAVMAATNS